MTMVFDEKARQWLLKNSDLSELIYNGVRVDDMYIMPMSVREARPYIASFHYSKTMPDSTRFCFAGYYKEKLAGIVCYGMGSNDKQYQYIIPDIKTGEYLELTRLWSPDGMPRNTESKLISNSLKLLPSEIKLVISYADSSQNHQGYIYQATNWYYLGMTNGGKMLVDENGITRHSKSINIMKIRHKELNNKNSKEIMDIYGWKSYEGGKKHRYCYLLGNKTQKKIMYKFIQNKILPYPKKENEIEH